MKNTKKIDEAFFREKQVQGWSRKKKEALINGWDDELKKAAACMNESHYKNKKWLRLRSVTGIPQAAERSRSQANENI